MAAPNTPPNWLLRPIMPAPVALDSPECSVLAATRAGKLTLSKPVPSVATATQRWSSTAKKRNPQPPPTAHMAAMRTARYLPAPHHYSACVTSNHLADRYYCERQGHEPQGHVVCMDQIGDEETDYSPKDNAVGKIDRQGHLEETQDHKGPIPGENDDFTNPLPAVFREQEPVGYKGRRAQQTRDDESQLPSAPVCQQGNCRHADHRCQRSNGEYRADSLYAVQRQLFLPVYADYSCRFTPCSRPRCWATPVR